MINEFVVSGSGECPHCKKLIRYAANLRLQSSNSRIRKLNHMLCFTCNKPIEPGFFLYKVEMKDDSIKYTHGYPCCEIEGAKSVTQVGMVKE